MQQLPECDIEIPLHSRVAIQCALKDFVEAGDHYLYICDVSAVCRSQEFHLDRQRHFAVHGNSVWTSNGNPPFVEIPLGRATALCRSQKFCLDEQRQNAVRKKSVRVMNGIPPLAKIPLGQRKPGLVEADFVPADDCGFA